MSRRHAAEKGEFYPDPKYGDVVLTKLMNALMWMKEICRRENCLRRF